MAKINLGRVVGKSAYELALDNGFVGSLNDWLLSLIGDDGKSAYELAVIDGFIGSISEWLLSLHGADGTDGINGTNGINGINGKSAYEIAVSNGFIGNESSWLQSLKGADGLPGTTDYNELDNRPDLSVYQTKTDELLGTISKNVIGAINEVNEKLPVIHSDLEELNGDPNFQHITATEKASYEAKQSTSEKGATNGYAGLGDDAVVLDSQNTKKVSRKGGTIYHSTKWFTPSANQTITISSDGLTATLANPVYYFQFTSAMVSALMEVNGVENILSAYTSASVVTFATPWPVTMRGRVYSYDKFGVYSKFLELVLGAIVFYDSFGQQSFGYNYGRLYAYEIADGGYSYSLQYSSFRFNSNLLLRFTNGAVSNSVDSGIKRNSAGIIEINDGNTGGVYRDLNLRNLNYTGSLTNTSDIRLKQNIRPVTDGLKKVIDIAKTIRHYEFIDQDAYGNGVITSEIAQYLLELGFDGHVKQRLPRNTDEGRLFGWEYKQNPILNEKDEPVLDGDGNQTFETVVVKEGDLIYTVDSQALTIYLFPAIVELNERIISIEERLNKAGL
jgi:hypothetical protein